MPTKLEPIQDNAAVNDLRVAHSEWLKSPMTKLYLKLIENNLLSINRSLCQKAGGGSDVELRNLACKLQAYSDVGGAASSFVKFAEIAGLPLTTEQREVK